MLLFATEECIECVAAWSRLLALIFVVVVDFAGMVADVEVADVVLMRVVAASSSFLASRLGSGAAWARAVLITPPCSNPELLTLTGGGL